jgi:two-component system chemotaxis sensor kinase CheA
MNALDLAQVQPHFPPEGRRATDKPGAAVKRSTFRSPRRRKGCRSRNDDSGRYGAPGSGAQSVRRDRLDQEPPDQPAGRHSRRQTDSETLQALDQAVSQLDLLVSDLQNSVMKTRMQPIGRCSRNIRALPAIWRDNWARMSNWR